MNKDLAGLDVSVIIVSWNAREFLMQCLASLYAGEGRRAKEIIVVDNASMDGSSEAVETHFPGVCLIRNAENLGFAKANNAGVEHCTGRYICFINSDAKVIGDCIGQLVDYCETHSEVGLVGPRVMWGDGRLQRSCRGFPTVWTTLCGTLALDTFFPKVKSFGGYSLAYWPQEELREVDILSGCFWLARREAMNQVGLLDEEFFIYGEDMDWCKRFRLAGWKNAFVPSAQAVHYGGASSANAPVRFYVEMHKAELQYWRKHHDPLAVACYRAASFLHALVRVVGWGVAWCLSAQRQDTYHHKFQRSKACLWWLLFDRVPGKERPPNVPLRPPVSSQ